MKNNLAIVIYITLFLLLTIHLTNATVQVPFCDSKNILSLSLSYINGTKDNTTTVTLCHDDLYFYVEWNNIDD